MTPIHYPLAYYIACGLLWAGLAVLCGASLWRKFPDWLRAHPKVMVALLGIDQLPRQPVKTLRRFYFFLNGGWTWLLVWSWWVMPMLQKMFYQKVASAGAFQIARISSIICMIAYAAVGFFAIAKSIRIWIKEIYYPPTRTCSADPVSPRQKD